MLSCKTWQLQHAETNQRLKMNERDKRGAEMKALCEELGVMLSDEYEEEVTDLKWTQELINSNIGACLKLKDEGSPNQTIKIKLAENYLRNAILALHELHDLKVNSELHRLRKLKMLKKKAAKSEDDDN